jgi:general secretion pathway protein C
MNIASQTQSLLHGFIAEKELMKWLETLNSKHLPKVVMVVLTLMIASQSADLTWRLLPQPESKAMAPRPIARAPQASANSPDQRGGLEKVADLHLLGKAGAVKTAKKIDQTAPITNLNLTLHGVYVDEDPELGAAIIGTSGSTQKYYKAGASVMSGVTLQGVFEDRVVLLRNGQPEVLRFPKVPSVSSTPSSNERTGVSTTREPPSQAATSSPTTLSGYREVFQNEPLKIFEHVRFVPVRSREGLKGYRVLPQKNRELYNKLGIRPSDLVTAVNGVGLNNDQEAMRLMQTLQDASTIQVDIIRNGQPQSLTFNLN